LGLGNGGGDGSSGGGGGGSGNSSAKLLLSPKSSSQLPAESSMPAEVVEKYAFVKKVGKGGFASVYRAEGRTEEAKLLSGGRPYAVKVVEFDAMGGKGGRDGGDLEGQMEQVRQMTITEVDIMGKAEHPNIIRLYEVYEHMRQMWLVIE